MWILKKKKKMNKIKLSDTEKQISDYRGEGS